jgi:hypothetical protein
MLLLGLVYMLPVEMQLVVVDSCDGFPECKGTSGATIVSTKLALFPYFRDKSVVLSSSGTSAFAPSQLVPCVIQWGATLS